MSWILTLSVVFLILYIVIVATIFVDFYHKSEICFANPSPWCWKDWKCSDGSSPVDSLNAVISGCSPENFVKSGSGTAPPECSCPWESNVYDPTTYKGGANMCIKSK